MISKQILADIDLPIERTEPVYGGDINSSYCLHCQEKKYFLKINDHARFPSMFELESKGLVTLLEHCDLIIPSVIREGISGQYQFLVLEWLDRGKNSDADWETFGKGIAGLHACTREQFGWEENNYIGSLVQQNSASRSWEEFYLNDRLLPFTTALLNRGDLSRNELEGVFSLGKKLGTIFPTEPPALLHGDLWSGNFMITGSGKAAVYDPAIYYGHREMDIGMSRLFGGFDARFYHAYHECYPLEPAWEERLPLTQLYPLLVHAMIFGGHYVPACRTIINAFR